MPHSLSIKNDALSVHVFISSLLVFFLGRTGLARVILQNNTSPAEDVLCVFFSYPAPHEGVYLLIFFLYSETNVCSRLSFRQRQGYFIITARL